jgi:hypothetical protein
LTFFSNGNGWDSVENWRYHLKTKQTQFISAAALAFQAFSFFFLLNASSQPAYMRTHSKHKILFFKYKNQWRAAGAVGPGAFKSP